jgi:hypothetical protein
MLSGFEREYSYLMKASMADIATTCPLIRALSALLLRLGYSECKLRYSLAL